MAMNCKRHPYSHHEFRFAGLMIQLDRHVASLLAMTMLGMHSGF